MMTKIHDNRTDNITPRSSYIQQNRHRRISTTMMRNLHAHLLAIIGAFLWIAGTSGFCALPTPKDRIGNAVVYSSVDDGGQSAYEQQMKGMQNQPANPPQNNNDNNNPVVPPQPNRPNEAQLMKVQERQFLDRPIVQPTPTPSATTPSDLVPNSNPPAQTRLAKRSDYVDFEPDPQYFWKRDEHDYEISETRWVRNKKRG